jgi:hypothetical protein
MINLFYLGTRQINPETHLYRKTILPRVKS